MTPDMMQEAGFVSQRAVSLWEEDEALVRIAPDSTDEDIMAGLDELGDEALDAAFDDDFDDDLDEGFEDEEGD